jgi:hypothetical protein
MWQDAGVIDEFRAAFQELIDASVATDPRQFPTAVHTVYRLASQVPVDERELALEALGPVLAGGHTAPGVTADLSVVAGAMVEMGTDPGGTGVEVMRLLRSMGQGAAVFLYAWDRTGGGTPPDPDEVTAAAEERVAAELGETAPTATMCWWTIRRYGLAAKTMLSESSVRQAMRSDAELRAELVAISNQLSAALPEFEEVRALLRMSEATSALVLDRASGRGFRVLFDGIGDNFQLHTLLADALVGEQGRGLAGERPDPRWTASFRDADPDPEARVVRGWWNLVAVDGSWVWNEGVPADIPTVDGEHVLVLDEQPYARSWSAGRRHPHVRGWLEVESELAPEEVARWWSRTAPAQSLGQAAAEGASGDAPADPAWEFEFQPAAGGSAPEDGAAAAPEAPAEGTAPVAEAAPQPQGSSPSATQQVFGFVPEEPAAPDPRPEPAAAGWDAPSAAPAWEEPAPPAPEPAAPDPRPEPAATGWDEAPAAPAWEEPAPPAAEPDPAPAETAAPEEPRERPQPAADAAGERADPVPPGAGFLPPLPPGVSDSAGWGPAWR